MTADRLPVVIAGAGPSGSTLALCLAKKDIPVVLLEKQLALPVDLRASTFHPASLDLLAELDPWIVENMLARGLKAPRYQYRDRRSGETATFDMQLIADETGFPFRLQLEQYELTRLTCERLQSCDGVDVRFGHEVTGYHESGDCVQVEVLNDGEEMQLDGAFVVGAEGARSNVRKSAGIDFLGFTYDEKFLVVSTSFPFEQVFDDFSYVNYVADPEEWCVVLRTDKHWRVLFPTTPETDADEQLLLSEQFIQERLHHLYDLDGDYDIKHRSLYAVNQRVAETYTSGRMAMIGDACHINNPLGGMGMNGGLHDAFCLGEKFDAIYNEGADYHDALAHYDRQRKDVAVRFVQEHTIQNKKLMESTDPDIQKKRQKMLMRTAADPMAAREFLLERAMINCLRDSQAAA
ncbi:MAG: FAD-dependent monooxygenase [Gammaproteobacteria bacterium]|nr:FAD-dependent monooxygenase [Gammaproteobacteria bacterium]